MEKENGLIEAIEREARREEALIRETAQLEVDRILGAAKKTAEELKREKVPVRLPASTDEGWVVACREFAAQYGETLERIGVRALEKVNALDADARFSLLSKFLKIGLGKLPGGSYAIRAPREVLEKLGAAGEYEVEKIPVDDEEVLIVSADGKHRIGWSLESVISAQIKGWRGRLGKIIKGEQVEK